MIEKVRNAVLHPLHPTLRIRLCHKTSIFSGNNNKIQLLCAYKVWSWWCRWSHLTHKNAAKSLAAGPRQTSLKSKQRVFQTPCLGQERGQQRDQEKERKGERMRGTNMTSHHISPMSTLCVCVVDTDTLLFMTMLYSFFLFLLIQLFYKNLHSLILCGNERGRLETFIHSVQNGVENRRQISYFLTHAKNLGEGWAKCLSEFFKFNLGPNLSYTFAGRCCARWPGHGCSNNVKK